ncbi:MAG: bifunctional folylpolyglutamate synthase/dihydrofolate synthase [Anaerolineales bacterium]|nr:bifunctional folylpolyglutamate synthase/dihydrofolate synthase [Anaerolineales bacterium]
MEKIDTYQQALDYLFSFVDFSLTHQEQIAPERFELERMFRLMAMLGNPQQSFGAIHIAGTKGKGSVAAHCAAALQSAGWQTGLYTSPHLADFRERIQVNGEIIPRADFVAGLRVLQGAARQLPGVTSYELQTALAFWYFAQKKVDFAAVEVGMGGRLDSTNILTPLVAVITNISYDHTAILGDTLEAIAGEKGGIIKEGVPVVSAPQQPEALAVIEQMAKQRGSDFVLVGRSVAYQILNTSLEGQEFAIVAGDGPEKTFTTRLLGAHQVENAVTAHAALRAAAKKGGEVSDEAIREGFAQVSWPGRFEVFPGHPVIVLDGAHNQHSARRLAETMKEYFPGKRTAILFGASEDKNIAGMFAELLPLASDLVLYAAHHPRAAAAADLAVLAAEFSCPVTLADTADHALAAASEAVGPDGVVLVTGSLYLVGELRAELT